MHWCIHYIKQHLVVSHCIVCAVLIHTCSDFNHWRSSRGCIVVVLTLLVRCITMKIWTQIRYINNWNKMAFYFNEVNRFLEHWTLASALLLATIQSMYKWPASCICSNAAYSLLSPCCYNLHTKLASMQNIWWKCTAKLLISTIFCNADIYEAIHKHPIIFCTQLQLFHAARNESTTRACCC